MIYRDIHGISYLTATFTITVGTVVSPSKRQKLAVSLPTNSQDQSSNFPKNYKCWRKLLVDFYLADDSLSLTWPSLKASQFVQLSLVSQRKEARHIDLKTVYGKIDEVYGDKTSIDVKNVFDGMVFRSFILFEGRPGSGKTTLMIKISCEWAKGDLFQSKLVFLVQLRRLGRKRDIELCDLIRVACRTLSPKDICGLTSYIEGTLGEDVVFILDGFDEYAPGVNEENFVYRLIAKYVFPESIVIVSSRPAATQPFRRIANRWIEVVGFMEEQIREYIYSYFEDSREKAKKLVEHLEQHPNLMNICYLPLHCAMLVYLDENMLPETETEFFRAFTLSSFVRYTCKKSGSTPLQISSFSHLSPQDKELLHKISKLAFTATVDSRQVFQYSELRNISMFEGTGDEISGPGLVVMDKYFVLFGHDKSYTFLHLTLQEYLSAVYISLLSTPEQKDIIREHGKNPSLFVTLRFLFGTLDYSRSTTASLFNLIMEVRSEIDDSWYLSMLCAIESQSDLACSHIIDFYRNKLIFSDLRLMSTDMDCIIRLLKCSKCKDIHLSFINNVCNLSKEDATTLLQGIDNCRLSLTFRCVMYQLRTCSCIHVHVHVFIVIILMHTCIIYNILFHICRGYKQRREHFIPLLDVLNTVSTSNLVHLE